MGKCIGCYKSEASYQGRCSACNNKKKRAEKTPGPAPTERWTFDMAKRRFKFAKYDRGEYLAGDAASPHIHTYEGAAHAKVGTEKYVFVNKLGKFIEDAWNGAADAIGTRFKGAQRNDMLTAMASALDERGKGTNWEIDDLVSRLPFDGEPTPKKV